MGIIVKKFGGTSVGSIDRIKKVAKRISEEDSNNKIVVVVSAMGKTTDELNQLAKKICENPAKRELDMLLTAGERISMSLLSIALQDLGLDSISFTGSQSGVITNCSHGNARIKKVTAFRIREELEKNKIVIVAGFQGVSPEKEITTLGRGGSDTTAVALACYLNAERCEIFTDVEHVMTADPRIVKNSIPLKMLSYDLMLAFAKAGAKVIHPRAIEFAKKYNKTLELKSSFANKEGTLISDLRISERTKISGISSKNNLVKYTIKASLDTLKELYIFLNDKGLEAFYKDYSNFVITIYLCENDSSDFESFFNERKSIFEKTNNLSAISLIGIKISSDLNFLSLLTERLKERLFVLDSLYFEDLKVIMISNSDTNTINDTMKFLHQEFIEK